MNRIFSTRREIYLYAFRAFSKAEDYFQNSDDIKKMFLDSATLLIDLEKKPQEELLNVQNFNETLERNIQSIENRDFANLINSDFNKRLERKIYGRQQKEKQYNWNDYLELLVKAIIDYQNKIIQKLFKKSFVRENASRLISDNNEHMIQTFLSYAFKDKGLSFVLFLYFLNNGGFLFVDWMLNDDSRKPIVLKRYLFERLKESEQFLFFRTSNSEFKASSSFTIRQWCAWECGVYYSINSNEKYILNLYDDSPSNTLLKTFKPMGSVENGKIIPLEM